LPLEADRLRNGVADQRLSYWTDQLAGAAPLRRPAD
jgi:hypothetical protein